MKEEFYIVLPSNSSMHYFSHNNTTRYVTRLPHEIRLQGTWTVALAEIQIPLTFQHISSEEIQERKVCLRKNPLSILVTNNLRKPSAETTTSFIHPGVYKNLDSLIKELNNLVCVKDHLNFTIDCGGYTSIKRICDSSCSELDHYLELSNKIKNIFGFETNCNKQIEIREDEPTVSNRPASLLNALPSMLMIYSDICEPYVTGDAQTRLLRGVPLSMNNYTYGCIYMKHFSPLMYIPLLFNTFQTIEIDIRDQKGTSIPFDFGTLTVTLHFKRLD